LSFEATLDKADFYILTQDNQEIYADMHNSTPLLNYGINRYSQLKFYYTQISLSLPQGLKVYCSLKGKKSIKCAEFKKLLKGHDRLPQFWSVSNTDDQFIRYNEDIDCNAELNFIDL